MSLINERFVNGVIWQSSRQVLVFFLSFVTNILLARMLSPTDFGAFFLSVSIIELIYILGSWSLSIAIIQVPSLERSLVDTAFILSLFISSSIFFLTLVLSLVIRNLYSDLIATIVIIVAALRGIGLISSCYGAIVEREMHYKKFSVVQLFSRVGSMITSLFLAVMGAGIWSLVAKEAVIAFLELFGMRIISSWRFGWQFKLGHAKFLLSFGSKMIVSRGLESFLYWFPNFIIGNFAGTKALGYFSQAMRFADVGTQLSGPAINQVSLAAFSRLQAEKNKRSEVFSWTTYGLFRLLGAFSIVWLLLGEDILALLLGETWRPAGKILRSLFPYVAVVMVAENAKHLLYSSRAIGIVIKIRLAQIALFIGGLFILFPNYGLFGVAVAYDAMWVLALILSLWFAGQFVQFHASAIFIPPILSGTIVGVIFFLFRYHLYGNGFSNLLLLFAVGIVLGLYLGLLFIFEPKMMRRSILIIMNRFASNKVKTDR